MEYNSSITIKCDQSLKMQAKKLAADKNIDKLNEAYLEIFGLGLKEFEKESKK